MITQELLTDFFDLQDDVVESYSIKILGQLAFSRPFYGTADLQSEKLPPLSHVKQSHGFFMFFSFVKSDLLANKIKCIYEGPFKMAIETK